MFYDLNMFLRVTNMANIGLFHHILDYLLDFIISVPNPSGYLEHVDL